MNVARYMRAVANAASYTGTPLPKAATSTDGTVASPAQNTGSTIAASSWTGPGALLGTMAVLFITVVPPVTFFADIITPRVSHPSVTGTAAGHSTAKCECVAGADARPNAPDSGSTASPQTS